MATIDAIIKVTSGIMTLVFGNMTLNVKIFSNPRPEELEEEEETNSIEVVTEHGFDLICHEDPVESALVGPVLDYDYYTPQDWEVR